MFLKSYNYYQENLNWYVFSQTFLECYNEIIFGKKVMFTSLYFYYWYIRTIPFRKQFSFPKVLGIEETISVI